MRPISTRPTSVARRAALIRSYSIILAATLLLILPLFLALANPTRTLAAPQRFSVTVSDPVTAGTPFDVTVTALLADGVTTDTGYSGQIQLTTSDAHAAPDVPILPGPYAFTTGTGGDNGTHTFVLGATLYTTPSQTITATDDNGTPLLLADDLAGTSAPIAVKPGPLGSFTWAAITTPQVAGTGFGVTATAYDTFSNVKTDYDGTGAVLTSTLGTSPAPSSTAPTVPSNLTWSSGTGIGSATITATRATKTDTDSGVTEYLTITSSIADGSRTATTANFAVTPNAVTTLTFSGQPIDTQVNTGLVPSPIYSVCAPATTTPCALSTAAIPSSPVAVYAVDAFSNPVLSQNIGITGSWLDAAVTRTTSGGTAAFGDSLKESTTGVGRALLATAALNGAVQKTSDKFRVVTTLKGCTGATCINKALGSTNSRTYVNSWSQITTSGCFFCAGVNVLQSTQLTLTSAASQCGNSVWISDISDQRVTGTNPQVTSSGRELIVVPKATLKSSGVLNRGVPSFNICFGAIWIGPGAPTQGWLGKKAATNNTPTRATEVQDGTVVPQGERWYGIPANCGTAGLSADDPCILLRTKQKADVLNLLGSDAASIMTDADLAIVVRVGGSWDGGSHPF